MFFSYITLYLNIIVVIKIVKLLLNVEIKQLIKNNQKQLKTKYV